jgi:hypothetical protein
LPEAFFLLPEAFFLLPEAFFLLPEALEGNAIAAEDGGFESLSRRRFPVA